MDIDQLWKYKFIKIFLISWLLPSQCVETWRYFRVFLKHIFVLVLLLFWKKRWTFDKIFFFGKRNFTTKNHAGWNYTFTKKHCEKNTRKKKQIIESGSAFTAFLFKCFISRIWQICPKKVANMIEFTIEKEKEKKKD